MQIPRGSRYQATSTNLAPHDCVRKPLDVLTPGSCEVLKAGVHGAALGLIALMGIYNAAAWLRRRDPHLAVNAILYGALTVWERHHVRHHIAAGRPRQTDEGTTPSARAGTSKPTNVAA
jgi:hypothetical protein